MVNRVRAYGGELSQDTSLIAEVARVMRRDWSVQLRHISRSANKVADFLARHILRGTSSFQAVETPPELYNFCC